MFAPRGGLQNLLLDWYHPSDPRGRILRETLPYVEYWRYRNPMCAIDHAEDHQGPAIGRPRQLQYDFQKVRKDPWLVQQLRELAQRSSHYNGDRREALRGEVRFTRNARIWHTVFFEDTKIIIYTRGFEMGVAKGISAQGNSSTEPTGSRTSREGPTEPAMETDPESEMLSLRERNSRESVLVSSLSQADFSVRGAAVREYRADGEGQGPLPSNHFPEVRFYETCGRQGRPVGGGRNVCLNKPGRGPAPPHENWISGR